jgi:hypothetical protein
MITHIHPFLFWECGAIGLDIYEQEDTTNGFVCTEEYPTGATLKIITELKIGEARKLHTLLGKLISEFDRIEEETSKYFEEVK